VLGLPMVRPAHFAHDDAMAPVLFVSFMLQSKLE
jgi:hypothetical protein